MTIIMAVFMLLGAIDHAFCKDRFGLGKPFLEGIYSMGSIALAMVGMMCFAPILGKIITPIFAPFFRLFGADPAMMAGSFFPVDMGGFPLAVAMSDDPEIWGLSGIMLGCTLGVAIIYLIPVALGIIDNKNLDFLAEGIIIGISTTPVAVLVGGMLAGVAISKVIINLLPVLVLCSLLIIAFMKFPKKVLAGFQVFAKGITMFLTITFAIAVWHELTGIIIIPGMNPIMEQLDVVGKIAITLAGAYPMVSFITKIFSSPLLKIGKKLGINDVAVGGMLSVLTNSIPMFHMVKDMNGRGKIMAIAFSVSATATFGPHLAYVSTNLSTWVTPMIIGKLVSAVTAVLLVILMTKDRNQEIEI